MKKIINKNTILFTILFAGLLVLGFLMHYNLEKSRKIYVYSLDEVLLKTQMVETKQKFDTEIVALNKELLNTEKKIKTIKNAKVKADFSEVYLKNLRMKRDELIENYKKSVDEITQKINAALEETIKEKDINAVFFKNSIAAKTPHVIDLTDEIVEKIKK